MDNITILSNLLLNSSYFSLKYVFVRLGSTAEEIDIEKKEGIDKRGITYEFIIPYCNVIYSLEKPLLIKRLVKIIGSKKKPREDIKRIEVVGIEILSISFIFFLF